MTLSWAKTPSARLKQLGWVIGVLLSAALLLLARPGFDGWYLAWFSFVPLLWLTEQMNFRQAFLTAGAAYFLGSTLGFSWILYLAKNYLGLPSILPYLFYLLFVFYIALSLGLVFGLWRWLTRFQSLPPFFLFPFVYYAVWFFFPFLFDFGLAETQMPFPLTLQALDLFGADSMNFILPLSSGWLYFLLKLVLEKDFRSARQNLIYGTISGLILASWLVYGVFRLESLEKIAPQAKETVGIVQPNRRASLYGSSLADFKSWPEIQATEELSKKGVELVIWPEGNSYHYPTDPSVKADFFNLLSQTKLQLIFAELYPQLKQDVYAWYNAAILLRPDGKEQTYFKRVLVPFGEYLPGEQFLGWLEGALGKNFSSLQRGESYSLFAVPFRSGNTLSFIPILCYESLYGRYVAGAAAQSVEFKVLLTLSQDGWYGSRFQVAEHSYITALRGIENRLPVLHVVQNGFSTLSSPTGRILAQTPYDQAGGFSLEIPVWQDQTSFYQSYPWLFPWLIGFSLLTIFALPRIRSRLKTRS